MSMKFSGFLVGGAVALVGLSGFGTTAKAANVDVTASVVASCTLVASPENSYWGGGCSSSLWCDLGFGCLGRSASCRREFTRHGRSYAAACRSVTGFG